ncbi:IS66 family insertion sequence element accessory protein TnpB [Methylobacter sp. G7]|uniref:IS66 family insertion sequence element accessory protein TnpA n=1 Tax=Methylobacter sp. G7 TaxID=3230117 RepID=UPI003D8092AB
MKISTQWRHHVNAWHQSGLSQADYCRQQDINPKTFSRWTRHELAMDKDAPLEVIPIQVVQSAPAATTEANVILRLAQGAQLELSTAVSPRWLAELLQCLA